MYAEAAPLRENGKLMSEELHAQFFAKARILVKDMTDNEIRAWQDEMSQIALEARANYSAGDAELRERLAKNPDRKSWLVSPDSSDPNVSSAISVVKKRDKTNKADKLKATMLALGMDADEVNKLMSNVVLDGKTASRKPGEKTYSFSQRPTDENLAVIASDENMNTHESSQVKPSEAVPEKPGETEVKSIELKKSFNPFAK
jgi:hypothetical protein